MIPRNYQEWKKCIEVDCGIKLSPGFISKRISVFNNPKNPETIKFKKVYGLRHLQNVLSWYELAAKEFGRSAKL